MKTPNTASWTAVHRCNVYKATAVTEPEVVIKDLNRAAPLLCAAQKAICPRQLTEDETKDTARRTYLKNILDPPCFDKKAEDYPEKGIATLQRTEYLGFLEALFVLLKRHSKNTT